MAKETVNLDGLIRRADISSAKPTTHEGPFLLQELEKGHLHLGLLRKPQFQRETDDWTISHVVGLIRSFRDGDLIPAVIMWAAEGMNFVIDGAHRLSVYVAWVNDDYGDMELSTGHFRNDISQRQKAIAKKCREAIAAEQLEYRRLVALVNKEPRTPDELRWSSQMSRHIVTQWVPQFADPAKSFLTINQKAVVIDKTEHYMIAKRNTPAVIAARAIVNKARGWAYWGRFEDRHVKAIEAKGVAIHDAIFEPEDALPDTDMDLQPAGPAYTANGLRIALELVFHANDIKKRDEEKDDESGGEKTARYIEVTNAIVKHIAGGEHASLGLHPSVYFWGTTGNHRPAIFLAVVLLMKEMIERNELITFTTHRARFEEFLVGKSGIGQALLSKQGGWVKSVNQIKKMFRDLFQGIIDGKSDDEIETELRRTLDTAKEGGAETETPELKKWRRTKAGMRIRMSLQSAPRCTVCKARMVAKHISADHVVRRADKGSSDLNNVGATHQFCNTGFKNFFDQKGEPLPNIPSQV